MGNCQDREAVAELEAMKAQAEVEEHNKAILRRAHSEVWSMGDLEVVEELYAPDYVAHWTNGPDTHGLQEFKKVVMEARTAFPDYTETIEQIVAEGNLVVTRFTCNGTLTGTLEGIPATGNRVSREEIAVHRIVDGRIVEQWTVADSLVLMQQLGMELKPKGRE